MGDCHFAPSSVSCFNCRGGDGALFVAITAATDKLSTRDLTLRAYGRRWSNGSEAGPFLFLLASAGCWVGPLFFVCFAAVAKLFYCQHFPTLHLSSVSCVFSRPNQRKRNPPTITMSSRLPSLGQGAQTIPRIRVSARHNSHRQHQGTCLTEELRDINLNFDTDERLAVVTGDLNPDRAKWISSSWCECAASHDRVATLKYSDAKSADSLMLAQAILAQAVSRSNMTWQQ